MGFIIGYCLKPKRGRYSLVPTLQTISGGGGIYLARSFLEVKLMSKIEEGSFDMSE